MELSFNLVTQPWISVRTADHAVEEISIRDAFRRASEIRGLGGDLASQDVVMLRLLLAIVFRAVATDRDHEEVLDQWEAWWDGKSLPLTEIENYLGEFEHRFDLFHTSEPFMQVPGMSTASGNTSGLVKLIAEVPDGDKFFSLRQASGLESISAAEAARWLVHAQAFDTSGIKSGIIGDARAKGGRAYPMGTGYTGTVGLVFPEGSTLLETLLLNLCLDRCSTTDSAVWERDAPGVGPSSHHVPAGTADLFTWQSRRILLLTGTDSAAEPRVTDALLTYGDPLRPENLQGLETMAAFKLSDNLTKREKRDIYWPVRHIAGRSMWRGFASLVAHNTKERHSTAPHVLTWVNKLANKGILEDGLVRLHIVGVEYGPQDSTIAFIIDDAMTGHVSAVSNPELLDLALSAVKVADDVARAFAHLGQYLREAAGSDPKADSTPLYTTAYAAMDIPFREWFTSLEEGCDQDAAETEWQRNLRSLMLRLGEQAVAEAGPAAAKGKLVDSLHPSVSRFKILDSASAHLAFVRELAARTPLASSNTTTEVHAP